ncbi:MAG: hypothetical protein MI717_10100 [Spirochaetales bacterium]|nr:hypothetical protein [Spirochaetales bacterium]
MPRRANPPPPVGDELSSAGNLEWLDKRGKTVVQAPRLSPGPLSSTRLQLDRDRQHEAFHEA